MSSGIPAFRIRRFGARPSETREQMGWARRRGETMRHTLQCDRREPDLRSAAPRAAASRFVHATLRY
jgi:hypothetical protein